MASTVVIIGILLAVVVIGAVIFGVVAAKKRSNEIQSLATAQGWTFVERDDSWARRWDGAPFTGRGRARNVIVGQHRGRPITVFEYVYTTTSSNGQSTTTQTHRFAVWAVGLSSGVPELAVGPEGIFGGKVAEAFGFDRVDTGDAAFDEAFKVKCRDESFARRVLHPAVVDLLRRTGPWNWRFIGTTMLAFDKGALDAAAVVPRLELMADLLDRVPADAWPYSAPGR